jgi:hypothetical protein
MIRERALSELRKDCIAAFAVLGVAMLIGMVLQWL